MGSVLAACFPYVPNSTLYPCPTPLPSCASDLHDLYCLLNTPPVTKIAQICGGKKIEMYDGITFSTSYRLTVPNGVKIGCVTGNCTIERKLYDVAPGSVFLHYCPFLTYDLNSKISIENVQLQDIYVTEIISDFIGYYVNVTEVKNATEDLVAFDNLKPIPGPLKIEASSKASTFTQKKTAMKKKGRDPKHSRQLQEPQVPYEVAAVAATAKAKLASDFAVADVNSDGVVDCSEAKEFADFDMDCAGYLKHFTGSTSAQGVALYELENAWFGGKPFA